MTRSYMRAAALLAPALGLILALHTGAAEPKYTVEQVMKNIHGKKNILKKVVAGNATDQEKQFLVENYESLPENKPPKGDPQDWQQRTQELLAAAKAAVQTGSPADIDRLKKAADCKACHNLHKED